MAKAELPDSKKQKLSLFDDSEGAEVLLERRWLEVDGLSTCLKEEEDAPNVRVLQFNTLADGEYLYWRGERVRILSVHVWCI